MPAIKMTPNKTEKTVVIMIEVENNLLFSFSGKNRIMD
jgi:hypothetical protein